MHSTITIELFGSYGARHVPSGTQVNFENRQSPKDPLGPLCRKLVEKDIANRDDLVHILRDGNLVFKRDRKLSSWADYKFSEGNAGIRRKKFHPKGVHDHLETPNVGLDG